ncbi:BLUF domain-containing protein [Sphingomonas nostoxanthinifaciens]|uniref:BLUF domain-containing protein n=1 Tax=Sphingomonas nostoxanthinifaciens TaxID=2872652 RepID=UPI001CC1C957|nr:BLUF domain-containing protein [Sphingomonas nostoxanthinifaciens]UAK25696.1 BLUF domain-containing protein [Sphingomonas nostoxanthinifaciens]
MHQIVYLSVAAFDLKPDDCAEILSISQRRNSETDVTGLLVFDGSRFIQALEGPESSVIATFDRIKRDVRHRYLAVMRTCPIERREFGDWSMQGRFVTSTASAFELSQEIASLVAGVRSVEVRASFVGFAGLAKMAFDRSALR